MAILTIILTSSDECNADISTMILTMSVGLETSPPQVRFGPGV